MKILAIDSSSNICGVAILENDKLIKQLNLDNGLTHSETLMPTIKQVLENAQINLNQIDLLVCDKGPGSFTGIRIGVATVMAFSDSLNIVACGISSLEALAYNVKTPGIVCSLIDAKNSNCYCGIYESKNENYKLLKPLFAENINNILDDVKKYNKPITFVGSGAIVNKDLIKENLPNSTISDEANLNAYNLGLAGLHAYKTHNLEDVQPLYLRKSQAERMLENKNANK